MKDKIRKVFQPTEQDYIEEFRRKNIPKQYNQIELVEELENDEIDHYISISNRVDGKTFNYLHYFIDYAIRKDVGFTLIARHYTVRFSYQQILEEIIHTVNKKYDPEKFFFIRYDFYIQVAYGKKKIGIITDLNQATDLKYLSNVLKHYPIIIYDEFLAIETDYLPDEWERIKTIYSSINRKEEIPYIKYPKVFYLGNAVNFNSPILANLNIFNVLEKHQINTMKQYDNVLLEMRRNDNVNEIRNLRAFREKDDNLTMGEFETNDHNIADEKFKMELNQNKYIVVIKLDRYFLEVHYNYNNGHMLLSVVNYHKDYDYNTELKDNTEQSIYLEFEKYFDDYHYLKYNKDYYKFDNNYSKDFVLNDLYGLSNLRIDKIVSEHYNNTIMTKPNHKRVEERYKNNYIERTKQNLIDKFNPF